MRCELDLTVLQRDGVGFLCNVVYGIVGEFGFFIGVKLNWSFWFIFVILVSFG